MSEKFGLDWWKEDAQRMTMFVLIMRAEAKELERQSKAKNKQNQQSKFRPRG